MMDHSKNGIRNQKSVLLRNMRKKAARKEKKRSSRRRVLALAGKIVLLAVSVSAAIMGAHSLLNSPVFRVKKIHVEGNVHLKEEVLDRYKEKLSANIFALDLKETRAELLEEPYVKDAFLRREIPDRVYIRVVERVPFAVVRLNKNDVWVDQEGRVLEPAKTRKGAALPLITGVGRKEEMIRAELLSPALNLIDTIRNYGYPDLSELREIEMTRDRGAVLHPVGQEFEIRCGTDDFLHRMILLKKVVADLAGRDRPVEHIDLRFQDQVVVGIRKSV